MPSMFEKTTKKLVKEIGDQELRPVKCLVSATKIHRFSLIRRKKACSWFWHLPDVPLDVSLMDILEPVSSVPDAAVVSASFTNAEVSKQQVSGSVNAGAEVGFSGDTAACRGSSLEYQIVSTPHETWTELQKRKLPDPEPYILKQCREAGVNLYVVTDTVELCNSPVLQDISSVNILGKLSIPLDILVKGEGQGEGLKVREKKLTVPKGSVVAYKMKQLVFSEKDWGILYIADDDDNKKTFPSGTMKSETLRSGIMKSATPQMGVMKSATVQRGVMKSATVQRGVMKSATVQRGVMKSATVQRGIMEPATPRMGIMEPATPQMDIMDPATRQMDICHLTGDNDQETFPTDFQLLQEEVSWKVKAAELSKDMQNIVFSNLLAMLGDLGALQDLMDMLEQEPFGHLDGPGGTILTELQKYSCGLGVELKFLIFYLLEALMVLSDIQHVLLAQSMEKRILLPQRDLVRSILEPNFNCSENTPFTLQPELLAPLQGEGLTITYGLLDECGLKMELNTPRSTWDPEAKEPLSALYGTLSVLSQLAEA